MWLLFAFLSATLLGFYDVSKKQALRDNAVIPVLFLNTLFCSIIFSPYLLSEPSGGWEVQRYIVLKSCIVLSSWILGYFGMKHLPITLVGPINATRPVLVLLGALLIFGERLNVYQWIGVSLALVSIFLLSLTGKREGIDFRRNRWILCIAGAAILGAISGLYDKFLMAPIDEGGLALNRKVVQSYYNIYQCLMMAAMLMLLWWPKRSNTTRFHWHWGIPLISLFLSAADFAYFYALSMDDAMISVVSMIRRGSVLVSFVVGAFVLREKNIRGKALDLLLILVGMLFLYLGSK